MDTPPEMLERVGAVLVPLEMKDYYVRMSPRVTAFLEETMIDYESGTILHSDERFLTLRMKALSAAFVNTVRQQHLHADEATKAAHSMLYDIAYSMGVSDADMISKKLEISDSQEILACGPLYFARTGWGMVTIMPGAVLETSAAFVIHFHSYSTESQTTAQSGAMSQRPSCVMTSGYSAGWVSRAFGLKLCTTEVQCRCRGDDECHFIMAPIDQMQGHVDEFGRRVQTPVQYEIYEFYGRQRMLQQMAERERQYLTIFQSSTDAFLLITMDGDVARANESAHELFRGNAAHPLKGMRSSDLGIYADWFMLEWVRTSLLNEGESPRSYCSPGDGVPKEPRHWFEAVARRVDETTFDADISVCPFRFDPERQILLIIRDVSATKEAQRQLLRASEAAREASRMKSDFIAMFSHEVRTPMNGVLGMASLLLESDLTPEQRRNVEVLQRSASSLLDLLGNVLDMASLEAGKLNLLTSDFDITGLVHDVADLYRPQAQRKRLDLRTNIGHDVPEMVRGDQTRVRQILANLIQNALKFTNRGSIDVSVSTEDVRENGDARQRPSSDLSNESLRKRRASLSMDGITPAPTPADSDVDTSNTVWVVFTVRDTGVGISQADKDKLFQPYEQGSMHGRNSSGIAGSGLGLAICKRLAEALGGDITLESELGKYTQITFSIPFKVSTKRRSRVGSEIRCLLWTDARPTENHVLDLLRELDVAVVPVANIDAVEVAVAAAAVAPTATDVLVVDLSNTKHAMSLLRARDSLTRLPLICICRRNQQGVPPARDIHMQVLVGLPSAGAMEQAIMAAVAASTASRPAASEPVKAGGVRRVLLVEDHPINQTLMVAMLRRLQSQVDVAGSGEDAVRMAASRDYDLVFMDYSLPGMDGLQATREIRALGRRRVPVIALTGDALNATSSKCVEAGIDAVLIKPVQLREVDTILCQYAPIEQIGKEEADVEFA